MNGILLRPSYLVGYLWGVYALYFGVTRLVFSGVVFWMPVTGFILLSVVLPLATFRLPRLAFVPMAIVQVLWAGSMTFPLIIRPLYESDFGVSLGVTSLRVYAVFAVLNGLGLLWICARASLLSKLRRH